MQRKSSTRTFCAFSLLFLFAQITPIPTGAETAEQLRNSEEQGFENMQGVPLRAIPWDFATPALLRNLLRASWSRHPLFPSSRTP